MEGIILVALCFIIAVVVEVQSLISIFWAYSLVSFWVRHREPKLKQIRHFPIGAVKIHQGDLSVVS